MKRVNIKTKNKDIIDYWSVRVDECSLSIDWAEADSRCWRCGCEKNLERCHIVPHSLGGTDGPDNFVLLCKRCHPESPNVTDKEIMWDWMKAYKISYYDAFWIARGMMEYEFIYKKSITQELLDLGLSTEKFGEIQKSIFKNLQNKATIHFGQPYFNMATIAGVLRMMVKQLINNIG